MSHRTRATLYQSDTFSKYVIFASTDAGTLCVSHASCIRAVALRFMHSFSCLQTCTLCVAVRGIVLSETIGTLYLVQSRNEVREDATTRIIASRASSSTFNLGGRSLSAVSTRKYCLTAVLRYSAVFGTGITLRQLDTFDRYVIFHFVSTLRLTSLKFLSSRLETTVNGTL